MRETEPGKEHPPDAPIRVLVADDHAILRAHLVTLLADQSDIEVVGEASTGFTAVLLAQRLQPDIVLMDIEMPRMNGVRATRHLTRWMPRLCVIGLTMHEEPVLHQRMRTAGAATSVAKSTPPSTLLQIIRLHAARQDSGPAPMQAPRGHRQPR